MNRGISINISGGVTTNGSIVKSSWKFSIYTEFRHDVTRSFMRQTKEQQSRVLQ